MTDTPPRPVAAARRPDLSMRRLARRYAAERRFRLFGLGAIGWIIVINEAILGISVGLEIRHYFNFGFI